MPHGNILTYLADWLFFRPFFSSLADGELMKPRFAIEAAISSFPGPGTPAPPSCCNRHKNAQMMGTSTVTFVPSTAHIYFPAYSCHL
jgi:hypothetical protein